MIKYICRNTSYEIDSYESVNKTSNELMDIAREYLLDHGYETLSEEDAMTMKHSIINSKEYIHFDNHGHVMIKVGVFWESVMDNDKHYRLVMKVKIYGNANSHNCDDEETCDEMLGIMDRDIRQITSDIESLYNENEIHVEFAGTMSFITDNSKDTWSHEKNSAMNMFYEI